MSTRENPLGTRPMPAWAKREGLSKQGTSGMIVHPAEIALLRMNSKPGEEGNELILRSGTAIPLTYADAVALRAHLLAVEVYATNESVRAMMIEVVF